MLYTETTEGRKVCQKQKERKKKIFKLLHKETIKTKFQISAMNLARQGEKAD